MVRRVSRDHIIIRDNVLLLFYVYYPHIIFNGIMAWWYFFIIMTLMEGCHLRKADAHDVNGR